MKIVLVLFFLLFVSACTSINIKKVEDKNLSVDIIATESSDSVRFFAIVNIVAKNNEIIDIKSSKLIIHSQFLNKKREYIASFDTIFGGTYSSSSTSLKGTFIFITSIDKNLLFIAGKDFKDLINSKEIDSQVELNLETSLGQIYKVIDGNNIFPKIDFDKNEFLKLIPWIEEQKDIIDFNLLAIRLMPNTGEFAPTSETFRVLMKDKENGTSWNSSEGLNFMQIIGKVEPSMVGDYKIYKIDYNLNKNKNYKINGENEVTFIIPAKPKDYVTQINYWKK